MKAATQAISGQTDMLDVKLCQLVSLLDKGKPVKMSKRAGTFVTLSDVMEAVGADVMRFIMLTRRNDQTLEFDYASYRKKRKTPVFMSICPCQRVSGVTTGQSARFAGCRFQPAKRQPRGQADKTAGKLAAIGRSAAKAMSRINRFYLIELSASFHGLWTAGREDPSLRFIIESDADLTRARLSLVQASVHVLQAGLSLLSVNAPEEM